MLSSKHQLMFIKTLVDVPLLCHHQHVQCGVLLLNQIGFYKPPTILKHILT